MSGYCQACSFTCPKSSQHADTDLYNLIKTHIFNLMTVTAKRQIFSILFNIQSRTREFIFTCMSYNHRTGLF